MAKEIPWQLHLGDERSRAAVVAPAIGVEERERPIPDRVMRVEVSCPFSQLAAALPVTGERQQVTDKFDHRSVSGVKGDGSLGCVPERLKLLAEIVSLGQGEMREVAGGGGIGRSLRRPERSIEAIGSGVEPETVLLSVHDRQHGPSRRMPWRLLDRQLQDSSHDGVLLGYHP